MMIRCLAACQASRPASLLSSGRLAFWRCMHKGTPCMSRTGSHMVEHNPENIESAKQKHLHGESTAMIPGTEGWSQTLASVSEAVVKAERAPEQSVEDMQAYTVEVIKKVHEEETHVRTGMDVSGQPSIKENLQRSATDPVARGYRQDP